MNAKDKWRILNPLQAGSDLDPPPVLRVPRGTLLLTLICAVAWAALLVILVGNWAAPADLILDHAAYQADMVEGAQR